MLWPDKGVQAAKKVGNPWVKPMFWSRCDKAVDLQLYQYTTFHDAPQLRLSWLTRQIWPSGLNRASKINLGLGKGSGLWYRARAEFGLQNEARSQLWSAMPPKQNKKEKYKPQPNYEKINNFVKQEFSHFIR